jgi:inactivated superfamily I helicase
MTDHTAKNLSLKLARISEALAEDVDELSDEQVLQEAREDGIDTARVAAEFRSSALSIINQAKRQRLIQARMALQQSQQSRNAAVRARPTLTVIKSRIQEILTLKPSLAIAFRDGKEISDDDWLSLWDDLVETGAVKEGDDIP